jgi:hypothetical protein
VVRAIITPTQSSADQRTPTFQRAAHTTRPLTRLDTYNVQILGPKTQRLEDQEAGKVCREAISQARRPHTNIITAARGAELGGADADIHTQDVRSRLRNLFAVRDEQGGRGRAANREPGEAGEGDGGAARGVGRSECACCRGRVHAESGGWRRCKNGRGTSSGYGRGRRRKEEKEGQEMRLITTRQNIRGRRAKLQVCRASSLGSPSRSQCVPCGAVTCHARGRAASRDSELWSQSRSPEHRVKNDNMPYLLLASQSPIPCLS